MDWLGYWDEFVQKARFKKLACLCHIKQNNLTYLGRVCTPCLSVSTGIYDHSNHTGVKAAFKMTMKLTPTGVNFINIYVQIFRTNVVFLRTCKLEKAAKMRRSYKKFVRLTLMKLTPTEYAISSLTIRSLSSSVRQ